MSLSIDTAALDADESVYDECLSPLPIGEGSGGGGGSKNGSSDEEGGVLKKTLVAFSSSLRVVLVPSRQEYKEAKCDLWFTGDDFGTFHETARSEVKTYAKSRSITNKEAKIRLYQPSAEGDEEDEDLYDDYMMGGNSRESSIDSERNFSMDSDSGGGAIGSGWGFSMPILSPTPLEDNEPMGLQRVDSMSILSAKKCKKKHKEKLEKEQQKRSRGSSDNGDITGNSKAQRSDTPEVTPRTERQDSVDESFGAMSSAPLFYEDLHLSVAVPTHVPLPNRERLSKKEAAEKQQQEEEPPVQMFQILMFFTLPLLGYYFLVYCM